MNAAPPAASAGFGSTTARHVLILSVFVFGLLVSLWVPLTDDDGVDDPAAFVDAVEALKPVLTPGSTVLIHPPWRDDVLDARLIERLRRCAAPVLKCARERACRVRL